ncbi:MAG: ATP-binding protein [Nitrospirota bacterium]|nr:ATP-binding protein [Nitrospirota bacterium]
MGILFPLKIKIIVLILLLALMSGGYAWYHYTDIVEHDTRHSRILAREVTADAARMLDELVDRTFTLLRAVARHPSVIGHDSMASHRLFVDLLGAEPHLLNVIAVDAKGRMFGSAVRPHAAQMLNHGDSPWFRQALKGPFTGGYHRSRLSESKTVMVALPVRDKAGRVAGAVAAPLNLDSVGGALKTKLWLPAGAILHVLDNQGNMLIDTEEKGPGDHSIPVNAASSEGTIENDRNGVPHLLTAVDTTAGGWKVIMAIPLTVVYQDAHAFGKRFIAVFLVLTFASLTAGLLFAERVGKRLAEVTKGMQQMEQGNLTARIHSEGNDELHAIAVQFNAMADARNRAEEALKETMAAVSEEKTRTQEILESIPDAISIQDTQFRVLYQNAAHKQILGDRTGEFCYQAYERNDGVCDGCGLAMAFRDGKPHVVVRSVPIEGRGMVHVEIATTPLRDGAGRIMAGIEVARDITGRMHMEAERERLIGELQNHVEQISRAKREWQATFDAITDPVSIHDRQFRVIRANRAFSQLAGIEAASIVNQKCYDMMRLACDPSKNCPHTATLQGVVSCSREVLDPRTNRLFQITTFPYHGEDGDLLGSVHIAKDVTEQKDQEQRLAMSERFAALGRMASGIAHEINNPLAAISGCAEGLLNRMERESIDPEMFKRYLSIIQEEVYRCKSITTSMLSFTRKESFERKLLDLRDVVRKATELIGFQGGLKSAEVVQEISPDLPLIYGSEGELGQVFLTLLTNALDAMDERGTVTIQAAADNGALRVTVRDTGPGIAPEDLGRLFEPFFTTKTGKGGSGLGLSIANRIIANHQGALTVSSKPGEGAVFTLTLPVPSKIREEISG